MPKHMNALSAAGTCTYMIFCRLPMSRSGGEESTANSCAAASRASVTMPYMRTQRSCRSLFGVSQVGVVMFPLESCGNDGVIDQQRRREEDHVESDEQADPRA